MRKFRIVILSVPLLVGGIFCAQTKKTVKFDISGNFRKVSDEILPSATGYENLRTLCKGIGPRFAGTAAYAKAVEWAEAAFKDAGATEVMRQDVKMTLWKRGVEMFSVFTKEKGWQKLSVLGLGGSVGTEGKELSGELLLVKDFAEFNTLLPYAVKGKIVFFNYPFDQKIVNPAEEYLNAGKYRWSAPSVAAKKGAKAVLVRSPTTATDHYPHTGSMYYDPNEKNKIPAFALGAATADDLAKALTTDKVMAKYSSTSGIDREAVDENIYADLPGSVDQKVIVVAAHLDTWDISEGAHDNGAGCVQVIEVLRVLRKMGYTPKHRLRFILFANEENGVSGGETYAEHVRISGEKHLFAIESDAGGYAPRGISMDMVPERRRQILQFKDYFLPYGLYDFSGVTSGQDIAPLKKLGVPLAELAPDMQRYFDIHHTSQDTFDKVNRRELNLGAIALAQMVMLIDQHW